MTPDKLNLALAKWDGWTCRNCGNGPDKCTGCDFDDYPSYVIPSYTADLNAVHELEKKLTFTQALSYYRIIRDLFAVVLGPKGSVIGVNDFAVLHATALQRCEALARTLGIWEDEQ